MKITVSEIKAEPKHLAYVEDVDELNERLARGVRDFQVARGIQVAVDYYRAGLDLFFTGAVTGEVVGTCARCLDDYPFPLDRQFAFVLTPRVAAVGGGGVTVVTGGPLGAGQERGDRTRKDPSTRKGPRGCALSRRKDLPGIGTLPALRR